MNSLSDVRDFGFRIADCGLKTTNPQSAIRNPQSAAVRHRPGEPHGVGDGDLRAVVLGSKKSLDLRGQFRLAPQQVREIKNIQQQTLRLVPFFFKRDTGAELFARGREPLQFLAIGNGVVLLDRHITHQRLRLRQRHVDAHALSHCRATAGRHAASARSRCLEYHGSAAKLGPSAH